VKRLLERILLSRWTKVSVFFLCLAPLARLLWLALHHRLTANPIEFITHATGDWVLRFLLLTLAITPLRRLPGLAPLIRYRRMLGLFAFFYAFLHFSIWIGLDQFFAWDDMWRDVQKRRYITVGFGGFLLLIPLAITSTAGWIRRLGGRRWQQLHRAIYFAAAAGVVHYYWLVKSDVRKPVAYGAALAVLLFLRIDLWLSSRKQRRETARSFPG